MKPRRPYTKETPMIVADATGMAWSDYDCTVGPRPLVELLTECQTRSGRTCRHPSSLLVCRKPPLLLLQLNEHFKDDSEWNFKLSIHDRDSYVNGVVRTQKEEAAVSFLGFRNKDSRNNWYHYLVAPGRFTRATLSELTDPDQPELAQLYEWGQAIYAFAQANDLKLGSSAGAMATQLLRDERFYPDDRRKVPTATNERAREALPGNHYELRDETHRVYGAAIYFDQENAHHYAAQTVNLPHADWLYARGYFHVPQEWCHPGTPEYEYLTREEYGLLHLRIRVPKTLTGFLPQWAHIPGSHDAYLFTNELDLAARLGVEVEFVYAAWTSPMLDGGLAKYSRWAVEQIKLRPQDKAWLKSVLLATYGILASKPRLYEFGYREAKGEPQMFHIGPEQIQIFRTSTKRKSQLSVANVIHRGMIEAETRRLSIELARRLEREGHHVLSIYADGVIVKDSGQQMPPLPKPWRAQDRLKFLVFHNPTTFESELLCKRPGVRKSLTSA